MKKAWILRILLVVLLACSAVFGLAQVPGVAPFVRQVLMNFKTGEHERVR